MKKGLALGMMAALLFVCLLPLSTLAAEDAGYESLLKNPSVEELNDDGTVTHWDVWPGNPDEGERKSWSDDEVVHSGARSVAVELVYSNPQAIYQYRVLDDNPFDFNQDYIFTAWVKMEDVAVYDGKGVLIGIKRRGADGEEYNLWQNVEQGTYDWTQVSIEAPRVDVEIVQYDVIFDFGAGTGTIWFDTFDLVAADLAPEETPEAPQASQLTPEPLEPEPEQTSVPEPVAQNEAPAKGGGISTPVLVLGIVLVAGVLAAVVLVLRKRKK